MSALYWTSLLVAWVWSVPTATVIWKFVRRRVDGDFELPGWAAALERDGWLQLVCVGALTFGLVLNPPFDLVVWGLYYAVLSYVRMGFWWHQSWDALGQDLGRRVRWLTTGTALFAPLTMPMLWAAGELTPFGYPPESEVGRCRTFRREAQELLLQQFRFVSPVGIEEPVDPASLPAVPAAFEGWRLYQLGVDALSGIFLVGMHGQRWNTIEFTARCADYRLTAESGPSPWEMCVQHLASAHVYSHGPSTGCGIYSTKAPVAIQGFVIARCLSYGVVAEHQGGYRAEHCRIEELFIVTTPDVTRPFAVPFLEARYGVPVHVIPHTESGEFFARWRSSDGDR